jgi:hypothetical protein
MICTSAPSIDAYRKFGAEEAKALIIEHRAAVLAIAEALMIERTLNAEQIDTIIANASSGPGVPIGLGQGTGYAANFHAGRKAGVCDQAHPD